MQHLTPEEIRCLAKTNEHPADDTAYIEKCGGAVEKLISDGYLVIGTKAQSLPHSDMGTIRKLLKDKGEKAGGKKADLVQRVLQSYSASELESAEIPKCFLLTKIGEQIISENGALLYYFKAFGATDILTPEQIISAQNSHPKDSTLEILITLFKEKATTENNTGKKRAITAHLGRLYALNHDDVLAREAELEVERLDKLWEAERETEAQKLDPVLGVSLERRRQLQKAAIDALFDDDDKTVIKSNNRCS